MIITRTADLIDFQLSDNRRVSVDVGQVAGASLAIERAADGRLVPALMLVTGSHLASQRIEASLEQLAAMHTRIVELMQETRGPSVPPARPAPAQDGYFPY